MINYFISKINLPKNKYKVYHIGKVFISTVLIWWSAWLSFKLIIAIVSYYTLYFLILPSAVYKHILQNYLPYSIPISQVTPTNESTPKLLW
jgi:hypothetical protein